MPYALSIVIPAYNEANRIVGALASVVRFVSERQIASEVIVVDDGSSDETAAVVRHFIETNPGLRIKLLRLGRNRGKGAALRAGVVTSKGARVLVMDADLATPLEALDVLWQALDRGTKIAIGSRALGDADIRRSQSRLRVLFGQAGNLWIRAWAVPGVHDTQCGFKLFEGETARTLFRRAREDRFGIDVEVLCLARRLYGLEIVERGIAWEHRDGSKVRVRDYLDVLVKVPRIALSVMRSKRNR